MNRSCTCICGDVGLVLIASLGLSLGFAGEAFGQCTNDAGAGETAEGEACTLDDNVDATNGGCNSSPPVFTLVEEDGGLPRTYCGNAATMLVSQTCAASCEMDSDCPDGDTCEDTDGDKIPDSCTGPAQQLRCRSTCAMDSDCPAGDTCEDTNDDGIADRCAGPGQSVCVDGVCEGANQPSIVSRDTDWYLVSNQELIDADTDGNGAVRIQSSVTAEAGLDLTTFIFSLDNTVDCNTTGIIGSSGCWDSTGGTGLTPALAVLTISEHPAGIIVFVGTGECDATPIRTGFECSTGLNDYVVTIESDTSFEGGLFEVCGDPKNNPNLGPCNQDNAPFPGCEDPECCKLVCVDLEFCCLEGLGWDQGCADVAVELFCAPELGGPVCMATGFDSSEDNYLTVCTDPYGSWSSDTFGGSSANDPNWGDMFNPNGAADPVALEVSFTNGMFMFDADNVQRELLSNIINWQAVFTPDASLSRQIIGLGSEAFDDSGNGEFDRLESTFVVTGAGKDLRFDLTQTIGQVTPKAGPDVSVLTQTYTITNNSGAPTEFILVRHLDVDSVFAGSTFTTDSVGTGTNANGDLGLYAFQGEEGSPGTYLTVAAESTGEYYGAKNGIDPDGPDGGKDGNAPAMSNGTVTVQWDQYGVPFGWDNYIAGIGANIDGESGPNPSGIPPGTGTNGGDGSIGISIPVSLAGAGPMSTAEVVVTSTYGAQSPLGAPVGDGEPCPWDCEAVPDGNVGINDFLLLLAQWSAEGSCDFNGGGVGIVDFLELLANWGLCP